VRKASGETNKQTDMLIALLHSLTHTEPKMSHTETSTALEATGGNASRLVTGAALQQRPIED